jgi:hypothetical protein
MNTARASRLALCLLAILSVASPARAQDDVPTAQIRLLSQTPWTTTEEPLLRATVRVRNVGDAVITTPEIGWTIGPKVLSRIQYETALVEGPAFAAAADTVQLDGDLAPGGSAEVRIRIDTSETGGVGSTDSAVYPLQFELRSEGERLAALTTAEIHLIQDPQQRVLFSWWTEIASPVAFAPDGMLIDEGFERTLEQGTGIPAQVRAIADVLAKPGALTAVDVIVSPVALDQLRQAADGYRRAGGARVPEDAPAARSAADSLEQLRDIASAPEVRLHTMPFAAPRVPALLSSGLRTHLDTQWRLGDETFELLIGERPDPTVFRPPGLAFDQASVDTLEARGVTTILGAADSVERPPQESGYAPPPAAMLSTGTGGEVRLVLPDPGAQAMLEDREMADDPVRAAQAVLGELATIWKERPVTGPDIVRGLALDLPPDLPAGAWEPLVQRLAAAPFLRSVHAEDLPDGIRPEPEPATLNPRRTEGFSAGYAEDLSATARDVAAFAAMLDGPNDEADLLQRTVLYAEASQFIGNEGSGRVWIDAVNAVTDRLFDRLAPDTSRVLTFTSRSGTIPLRMGDPGDRTVEVRVELASGRVEFLDGNPRTVLLDRANQVITFRAEVKAAGRSSIRVIVRSPDGLELARRVLVVSSTAVNPIALIITVGAGLVLIGLWSRRLFRRRNT